MTDWVQSRQKYDDPKLAQRLIVVRQRIAEALDRSRPGPNGRAYRAKFWICIHWPSDEQGTLMKQGYSKGAINPVRYLRWFPRIHEVSFPI